MQREVFHHLLQFGNTAVFEDLHREAEWTWARVRYEQVDVFFPAGYFFFAVRLLFSYGSFVIVGP